MAWPRALSPHPGAETGGTLAQLAWEDGKVSMELDLNQNPEPPNGPTWRFMGRYKVGYL